MIAAIPSYVPQDQLKDASPGQRFGLYFQTWARNSTTTEDWKVDSSGKTTALQACCGLTVDDRQRLDALQKRQQAIALLEAEHSLASFQAVSSAPFITGLGSEHPTENGFSFLSPYGLPYLPGSSIKGVLRNAARELSVESSIDSLWGDQSANVIDILFGHDSDADPRRGALTFLDCIPQLPKRNPLIVEIMTPHLGHYYQASLDSPAKSLSPHESNNPVPIAYLAVPPESEFTFLVTCNHLLLTEELKLNDSWRRLLAEAFEHAFHWMGFGAKTSLGYGAMERDNKKEMLQAEQREQAQREQAKAILSDNARLVAEFVEQCEARLASIAKKDKPNTRQHTAAQQLAKQALESDSWTAPEKIALADAIEHWLPQVNQVDMKSERKKLKLQQLRESAS